MKKLIPVFIFLTLFIFLTRDLAAQDFYAVLKTSRTYMDYTREYQTEYWFCNDKTCIKRSRQTTIVRNDLDVVWTIFGKKYIENKLNPENKGRDQNKKEVDIHTLGFERYTPDYDWIVEKTDKTKMIDGFLCEHYISDGDADFAEVNSEFWICPKSKIMGNQLFNKILQNEFKNDKARQQIYKILKNNHNSFPVRIFETVVNSIAPNMVYEIQLIKFEETTAPKNIYDLPEGLEKRN